MLAESRASHAMALTLSGGGFRATLFHLGVIRFLREVGRLSEVTHITSVSGGSILAAHLVLNWELYNGREEDFNESAAQLVRFVRTDVRGRVVRRWLLSGLTLAGGLLGYAFGRGWTRTRLLESYYAELYQRQPLSALGPMEHGRRKPELHILATSLTAAELCSFTRQGFFWRNDRGEEESMLIGTIPIARAVTASSAFPPLFPPVRITHRDLRCKQAAFPNPQYLADGGVFDNLGVRKLREMEMAGGFRFDVVVVSDAQGLVDWQVGSRFAFLPTRAVRASDVLMKRVSDLEYENLGARRRTVMRCSLQTVVKEEDDPQYRSDPGTQRSLAGVRTDLESFSPFEADLLVRHGYAVARQAWKQAVAPADQTWSTGPPWSPVTKEEISPSDLDKSVRLRWRLCAPWAPWDWASWANLFLVCFYASLPWWLFFAERWRRQATQAEAGKLGSEVINLTDELREILGPGSEITLDNNFIERYKNRATADLRFQVDKVGRVHPPQSGGALFAAGRDPEIGLVVVAEIMNAKDESRAVELLRGAEGNGQSVVVSGAWRLWFAHAGSKAQVQGADLRPAESSNPDHAFEIHPVTRVGNVSTTEAWRPIPGFQPKDAARAFLVYESRTCRIEPHPKATTIQSAAVGYNYVEFILEATEEPREVEDGHFLLAQVRGTDGEVLVEKCRMVFVKGTPPAIRAKQLRKGDRLRVLGMPRIDLAVISWRVSHVHDNPKYLSGGLPYEMVVVAVVENNY